MNDEFLQYGSDRKQAKDETVFALLHMVIFWNDREFSHGGTRSEYSVDDEGSLDTAEVTTLIHDRADCTLRCQPYFLNAKGWRGVAVGNPSEWHSTRVG
jgi:hypothetical protein